MFSDVRWCLFHPVGSFEHVQHFLTDKMDRDLRLKCCLYTLIYGLFGTCALHLQYLSGLCPFMSGGSSWPCFWSLCFRFQRHGFSWIHSRSLLACYEGGTFSCSFSLAFWALNLVLSVVSDQHYVKHTNNFLNFTMQRKHAECFWFEAPYSTHCWYGHL